ncbi:MAG: MgtC/SapB family protein, partial [Elusimicrobiaceae bacterium]|nr:MgtC/SapB family protein [Elusimicrobiaceae bacterium]
DGNKISGLTTAASVWVVAAIGMAIGYGQFMLATLTAGAILILQLGVRKTIHIVELLKHYDSIFLICEPKWNVVEQIETKIKKQHVSILKQEITKQDKCFHVTIVATFTEREFHKITKDLLEMPEVYSLYK